MREIRYDPKALMRAIQKCDKNIDMFKRYIEKQESEKETLQKALEKELALREKEGEGKRKPN